MTGTFCLSPLAEYVGKRSLYHFVQVESLILFNVLPIESLIIDRSIRKCILLEEKFGWKQKRY